MELWEAPSANELAYLAIPYGHKSQAVVNWRVETFYRVDAWMIQHGYHIVSPMEKFGLLSASRTKIYGDAFAINIGDDWTFWEQHGRTLLQACHKVIVICVPGWQDSVGVKAEIEIAQQLGTEVLHLTEAWLEQHIPNYSLNKPLHL